MNTINIILLISFAILQGVDYYLSIIIIEKSKLKRMIMGYELPRPRSVYMFPKSKNLKVATANIVSVLFAVMLFATMPANIFTYIIIILIALYSYVTIQNCIVLWESKV